MKTFRWKAQGLASRNAMLGQGFFEPLYRNRWDSRQFVDAKGVVSHRTRTLEDMVGS